MTNPNPDHIRRLSLGEDAPDFFMDESLLGGKSAGNYTPPNYDTLPKLKINLPEDFAATQTFEAYTEPTPTRNVQEEPVYQDEYSDDDEDDEDDEYYDDDEEYYDEDEYYEDEYVKPSLLQRIKDLPLWAKISIAILIFIIAVIGTAAILVNSMLNKIQRPTGESYIEPITQSELQALEEPDPEVEERYKEEGVEYIEVKEEDLVWVEDTQPIAVDEHKISILLIGHDARPGEARSRSDTMMLLTLDKENKKIYLTSFLRDLYVQIPGYQSNRLNVPFALEGESLLADTLMTNFGVTVDHSIIVSFDSFPKVIDALGGVDIELTNGEANVVGTYGGLQHLNGEQALTYSRIRKLDSDFGRTNRQRTVLSALFESAKDMSLTELPGLINEIFPMVTTDMTNAEILSLATDLLPMLSGFELITGVVPNEGTYQNSAVRGLSVLTCDMEANRQFLQSYLED